MGIGIEAWDVNGKVTIDTNTMTGRLIGTRVVSPGYIERISVPITPGKTLWYYSYTQGRARILCYRAEGPPINQGVNDFTIQCDPAFGGGADGTGYVFYGER